jgi:predicted permease
MDTELRFHIERRVEDLVRTGHSPDHAGRLALAEFGGIEAQKDGCRDAIGLRPLDELRADLRYAIRTFRKSPSFTVSAVLTLGLAIGVTAAIFSLADAMVFRPPDVPRSSEIIRIFSRSKDLPFGQVSYPDYVDFRAGTSTLSGMIAYATFGGLPVSTTRNEPAQLLGTFEVSGNYFSVLEVEPVLGRAFRDSDDRIGAPAVAVISHSLWERWFQTDSTVIGRRLIVAKRDFTIIGVAPAAFASTDLLNYHPDLYIPLTKTSDVVSSLAPTLLTDRSNDWLVVQGRLASGQSPDAVAAEMTALARSLEQAHPETNGQRTAIALPEVTAREKLNPGGYEGSRLMLFVVGLVLLIACANVANLMMSHAAGRSRELAVRLAIGASRGRLIRQSLAESLLLAFGGGMCGLAVTAACVRYVSSVSQAIFSASDLRLVFDIRLDQRVLLVTIAASLLTVVLFGLAPALRTARLDLISGLKASNKTGDRRRRWLTGRAGLVASQFALSVIVLAVAGLSIRQFVDVKRTNPGLPGPDEAVLRGARHPDEVSSTR